MAPTVAPVAKARSAANPSSRRKDEEFNAVIQNWLLYPHPRVRFYSEARDGLRTCRPIVWFLSDPFVRRGARGRRRIVPGTHRMMCCPPLSEPTNVLSFQFSRGHSSAPLHTWPHIFRKLTRPGRIGCCQACR